MDTVLELRSVKKSYGQIKVLSGISLSLKRGHFYALLGKNGAGKSTLMRLLARHETFNSGDGECLGVSFLEDTSDIKLRVSHVSEATDFGALKRLNKFFAMYSAMFPGWDQSLFQNMISRLGLDLDRHFSELSRGQRMQVAFIAAAAKRPEIMLLDEITSVLDARVRAEFMSYLSGYVAGGGTVVLATNIVSEVHHHASDLIFLEDGRVGFNKPVAEVSSAFVKLRQPKGIDHAIFANGGAVLVGIDDDGAVLYLIKREDKPKDLPPECISSHLVRADETFIYLTQIQGPVVAQPQGLVQPRRDGGGTNRV